MIREYRIVNRGDGPKIEGTRITVYQVFEYVEKGYSREWIAALLDLSSRQVQAALDFIETHRVEVVAKYESIIARIRAGNPPEIEDRLAQNRAKLRARMAELAERKNGAALNARDHVGQ
jgi:uncharacterized protein (DUF433 family)